MAGSAVAAAAAVGAVAVAAAAAVAAEASTYVIPHNTSAFIRYVLRACATNILRGNERTTSCYSPMRPTHMQSGRMNS